MTRPHYDLTTEAHDYPPWDGLPVRTLLVCTHPRSGSTLLGEALYFSDCLGCPLEYFHRGFQSTLAVRWNAHEPQSYLDAVRRHRTAPNGVLAVKIFWHDLVELAKGLGCDLPADMESAPATSRSDANYRALHTFIGEIFPNPSFVYLHRRDRLRRAVSGAMATATGRWRDVPGASPPATPGEVSIEAEDIERILGFGDFCDSHWHRFFAAADLCPHEVTYEALARDYNGTIEALFAALGCCAPVPPARLNRQSDAVSEQIVMRYLRERWTRR